MAKYTELSDENKSLFKSVLSETSIPEWVIFETLNYSKQKDLYKIAKANDVIETITDGINFIIIINEDIFDQLEDNQQKLVLHECLAGVTYDPDKDVVNLVKPDFMTYTGVLARFGDDEVIALKESVKSLYEQKKQQEEEEKAARKAKRSKKGSN